MYEKIYIEGIGPREIKESLKGMAFKDFRSKNGYTSIYIDHTHLDDLKAELLNRKKEIQNIRISTIDAEYNSAPGEKYWMVYNYHPHTIIRRPKRKAS